MQFFPEAFEIILRFKTFTKASIWTNNLDSFNFYKQFHLNKFCSGSIADLQAVFGWTIYVNFKRFFEGESRK